MKRRPNGKNVEVALQLLQLSLALKSAVKKSVLQKAKTGRSQAVIAKK